MKSTLDITQYLNGKRNNGFDWYEPILNEKPIGIEFKIYGPDSNEGLIADDYYRKMRSLAERIKDNGKRDEFIKTALINKYCSCIVDFRKKGGGDVYIEGKKASLKDLKRIFYEAPAILEDIDRYFRTYTKSFLIDEDKLEKAVRNYFYLNHQHAEKKVVWKTVGYGKDRKKEQSSKTIYVRNIDKKNEFIKKFKQEGFEEVCRTDEKWAKLKTVPFPEGTGWLFGHFLEIWFSCEHDFGGNKIFGPRQIADYCECFGVAMSYYDKRMLLKMKVWAFNEIAEMAKESESD